MMAHQNTLCLQLGSSNGYLVPAREGYVLVDGGLPAVGWSRLQQDLQRHNLTPAAIKLVVVTHVHYDHVGALHALKQATGVPIMCHRVEADLLRKGTVVIPPGATAYGKVVHGVGSALARWGGLGFQPVAVDHVVQGGEALTAYGLDAQILHTPGHSAGSITVLGINGDAFVGDVAANHYPLQRGPLYPPFLGDRAMLLESWRKLLAAGARRIYPGHGRPFAAERLLVWLDDHESLE